MCLHGEHSTWSSVPSFQRSQLHRLAIYSHYSQDCIGRTNFKIFRIVTVSVLCSQYQDR